MKRLFRTKTLLIHAPPDMVFTFMDQISSAGMHMMKDSAMMMGSKLTLQQLSANSTGPDAKYRWVGKLLGIKLDFTVTVTKWVKDKEKIWETIGEPKMIILGWYRMHLKIIPIGQDSRTELSIAYTRPQNWLFRFFSFLLAPLYANWCLSKMLSDTKKSLESDNQ